MIGSNQVHTIKECLKMLINLSVAKGKIRYKVNPARVRSTELRILVGKFDKFYKKTGWKPEIPISKTMESILNYWREFIDEKRY